MPTTIENLNEAFSGESQANQKYRAFAKKPSAMDSQTLQNFLKPLLKPNEFMPKDTLVL